MQRSALSFEILLDRCIVAIQEQGQTVEDCLTRYPDQREELEPLLHLAGRLSAARALQAPPEFRRVAAVRMQNLVAARPRRAERARTRGLLENVGTGGDFFRGLQRKLGALFGAVAGSRVVLLASLLLTVVLLFGSGTLYVSAQALPGDLFYPVKTAVEDLRLRVSSGEMSDARLRLTFADRRLEEAEKLLAADRSRDAEQAWANYTGQLDAALALLDEDSPLSLDQRNALADLLVQNLTGYETRLSLQMDRVAGASRPVVELARSRSQTALNRALEVAGKGPDRDGPDPSPTPAPSATATASSTPEPPTASPTSTPEPPTATAMATATSTPSSTPTATYPPVPSPKPLIPSRTPRPVPTDWPIPTDWPVPTWWPPECPTPPDWPEEWPPECPIPTAWPTDWPLPTDWPFPTGWPTPEPAWPTPLVTPWPTPPPMTPPTWPTLPPSLPETRPTWPAWPSPSP